jgi:uncharacterized protein (TIGR03790 family)
MKVIVAMFRRFCIAEPQIAFRQGLAALLVALLLALGCTFAGFVQAQSETAASAAPAKPPVAAPSSGAAASAPQWLSVPRARGRLRAADIGLVINTADPYSVAVGSHYVQKRRLLPEQVLRIELPVRGSLNAEEFEALRNAVEEHFGPQVQALALAWTQPYAVECNSITGALALGFDAGLCRHSCGASRVSGYANSASARPYTDHGMRPSMLLAARDVDAARRLIDRGVAADRTLGLRAALPAHAYFLTTDDSARNVRARLYPPAGLQHRAGVEVHVEPAAQWRDAGRALVVLTGSVRLPAADPIDWLDGGLGDHLTSFGGQLGRETGQATALDWIASGATASHGSVSEPCNHLQKFPHPQWLLLHYLQGSTAIEAYWKSVLWPQQSLFVGEPLAAPFARR